MNARQGKAEKGTRVEAQNGHFYRSEIGHEDSLVT